MSDQPEKPIPNPEGDSKNERDKKLVELGKKFILEEVWGVKHLYQLVRIIRDGGGQMKKEGWFVFSIILLFVVAVAIIATYEVVEHFNEFPTQSQTVTSSNPVKSPVLQVGKASNVQQQIDFSTKNFQSAGFSNFASMIAPGAVIQNLIVNGSGINSNPADTELHEWITNFDKNHASETNDIQLTKKEVYSLTLALNDLDKKTANLEVLPDGRIKFGQIIAGEPTVVADAISNAIIQMIQNPLGGDTTVACAQPRLNKSEIPIRRQHIAEVKCEFSNAVPHEAFIFYICYGFNDPEPALLVDKHHIHSEFNFGISFARPNKTPVSPDAANDEGECRGN